MMKVLASYDHITLDPDESAEALRVAREKKHFYEKGTFVKEDATNPYHHILLNEIEGAEALRLGRERKYARIESKKYSDKCNRPIVIPNYTYEQLYHVAIKKGQQLVPPYGNEKGFVIDKNNVEVFKLLCLYFSGDPRFELKQHNGKQLSLRKSICLYGKVGTGKTTLMQIFGMNQIASYHEIIARTIADEYSSPTNGGDNAIRKYFYKRRLDTPNIYNQTETGYCIQDIGTETIPADHFGRRKNVIQEIILNWYDRKLPFNMLHLTTNLTGKKINSYYGDRAADRMKEMFNIIELGGLSRRK